ncbi:hypothetical protein BGZ63DRAFT_427486 [Mariannaea sp. PMI_226]|nr:hypothetical protein BGZ63DRAFT_427486 [Mariannaea sp. PMI_226]
MAELRQACDRCHSKKLKCPKQPGSVVCVRCAKASVQCIFSPPTRSLRSGIVQQPHLDGLDFDWPSLLSFDQVPTGITGNSANQPFVTTPPVSDNVDGDPSPVALLANLMTSLDYLHEEFPASVVHKHLTVEYMKSFSQSVEGKLNLEKSVELLLQRGQELSQLYPKVLLRVNHRINRPVGNESCTLPDCVHKMRQSLQTRQPPILDHSLINLLIACHMRFIDILDNIMDLGRLCSHVFSKLPKDHEPNYDIPEIRIGSFVAPRESAVSLITTMMVELQSSLKSQSEELNTLVVSTVGETSAQARALTIQCDILGQRAMDSLDDIRQLRAQLFSSGVLQFTATS